MDQAIKVPLGDNAHLCFRKSTPEDCQDVVSNLLPMIKRAEDGDGTAIKQVADLCADVQIGDDLSTFFARVVLRHIADKCLISCSDGFVDDSGIRRRLGQRKCTDPRDALYHLLLDRQTAHEVSAAIGLPFELLRALIPTRTRMN